MADRTDANPRGTSAPSFYRRYRNFLLSPGTLITLINAMLLVAGAIGEYVLKWDSARWLFLASALIGGAPIFKLAITNIFKSFDLTAGVMVSIAMAAAIVIGEYSAAALVAFMMLVGEMLEDLTVARADNAIDELENLVPSTATIRSSGSDITVALIEVKKGDVVLVRPGEHIPVDGVISVGAASVNQAAITGESIPSDKGEGEEVFAGTLCVNGALEITTKSVGETTMVGRMTELVKEARNTQAPVQRTANTYAQYLIPAAISIAIITWIITGDITRAITVLIVICPCSLVLATPTAVFASIGNAARRGVLVKNGPAMEQIGKVDVIAFDKTGTLTLGEPTVQIIETVNGMSETRLMLLAGSAERPSEHPLARAIVEKAQEMNGNLLEVSEFESLPGHGVRALVERTDIIVGERMLEHHGIAIDHHLKKRVDELNDSGCTVIPVSVDGAIAGLIAIADAVREASSIAIGNLRSLGIKEVLLLSGDKKAVAESVGRQLGVDAVHAQLLPEDKVDLIKSYKNRNLHIAFVGDGINDAPALALADVGIAMGTIGTAVAMESADIVLLTDRLDRLPHLITLSRKALVTIRNNVIFSMSVNVLSVALGAFGIIGPVIGAAMHEASALPVVANSARLIGKKPNENETT